METLDAIRTRRSVRGYLPKPVPRNMIEALLDVARWAPSGCNCQPWQVAVATGEASQRMADRFEDRAAPKERSNEMPDFAGIPPVFAKRLAETFTRIQPVLELQGLTLSDFQRRGSRFYDAPAILVISYDSNDLPSPPAGLFAFVTTLCLAAHAQGLGTCWMGMPLAHSDILREEVHLPESHTPQAVLALGYPDPEDPLNALESARESIETFTRWIEL